MTTPPTPAVVKPKRGRPAVNPEAEKVDLSSLDFTPAEMPKRGATDPTMVRFREQLGDSYETETGRATRVPLVALSRVEGMLRRAANDLEIGVSIAVESDEKGEPVMGEDGKVTVTFMGKDRRKRKTKAEAAAEEAGETGTDEATEAAPDSETARETASDAEREPVPVP